jgi:hypothetical protein
MQTAEKLTPLFARHIALPQDHGSWVFLFSPLLIGLFAGGHLSQASLLLIIAALAAFLLRQPVTIAVKVYSGRRSRRDLPAARFWFPFCCQFHMHCNGQRRSGGRFILREGPNPPQSDSTNWQSARCSHCCLS